MQYNDVLTSSKRVFCFIMTSMLRYCPWEDYKSFPASDPRAVTMFLESYSLRYTLDMLLNVVFGITHREQCRWTSILSNKRGILAVRIRRTLSDRWMPRVFELHRRLAQRLASAHARVSISAAIRCNSFNILSHSECSRRMTRLNDGWLATKIAKCRKIIFHVMLNINQYQRYKNFSCISVRSNSAHFLNF